MSGSHEEKNGRSGFSTRIAVTLLRLFLVLGATSSVIHGTACSQQQTVARFRALRGSQSVSFLCLGYDPAQDGYTLPTSIEGCPDGASDLRRRLHAVVTQQETGEVALIDLVDRLTLDAEATQPGFNFLPVGAEPVSIVSTPGGVATFVGVAEVGRPGLFALPTSCIGARPEQELIRDITSWPACRLPSRPGAMEILIDPVRIVSGQPAERASCLQPDSYQPMQVGQAPAAQRDSCPADLAQETALPGRRKLLVALPELGQLALIDAQELLDRPPGSFQECLIERTLVLDPELVGGPSDSVYPDDFDPAGCERPASTVPPGERVPSARPADFATTQSTLYVADLDAPKIHVFDIADPCEPTELPSLAPSAYLDRQAVVTTRKVAVSPATSSGQRFLYAIDDGGHPGSVIAFDVSAEALSRTPLIRPRASRNPLDPPDRIALAGEAADLAFGFRDMPAPDPTTGVAQDGLFCDPTPSLSPALPAAQYRPLSDFSAGASPRRLRGLFAFVALHSGEVSIVDVEDLDAPCRRPVPGNQQSAEDFRGCSSDAQDEYRRAGVQTTSGEASCQVVQPHRQRSGDFFVNDASRGRSAALRSFPRLTSEVGRSLASDQSPEGRENPKLLAVPFEGPGGEGATIFVGGREFALAEGSANRFTIDPNQSERSSLFLSFREPRAFAPLDRVTAVYEGIVRGASDGFFQLDETSGLGVLSDDPNALICGSGVQDGALTTRLAEQQFALAGADLATFVTRHTDYVQLAGELLEDDNPYWSGQGAQCGAELLAPGEVAGPRAGQLNCLRFFGPEAAPTTARDLRILEAYGDRLVVEPRDFDPATGNLERRDAALRLTACCFPRVTSYVLRAGHQWVVRSDRTGIAHAVIADGSGGRCIEDCSPQLELQRSRAFEIKCSQDCDEDLAVPGRSELADKACVVDALLGNYGEISPSQVPAHCIFQNLTTRFAIYAGTQPSVRDFTFSWDLQGGFVGMGVDLSQLENTATTPTSMLFLPQTRSLAITDGGSKGLVVIPMSNPFAPFTFL